MPGSADGRPAPTLKMGLPPGRPLPCVNSLPDEVRSGAIRAQQNLLNVAIIIANEGKMEFVAASRELVRRDPRQRPSAGAEVGKEPVALRRDLQHPVAVGYCVAVHLIFPNELLDRGGSKCRARRDGFAQGSSYEIGGQRVK